MAKPLREPPPTSSVARLLDVEAASRAITPSQPVNRDAPVPTPSPPILDDPQQIPPNAKPAPTGEPANIKREFVLSPSTDAAFSRLVELYRRSTGTRLNNSHVVRAVLKGIAYCMGSLERDSRRIGPLKLPSNARGREAARAQFENRIAQAFISGIRSAPAYDDEQ